MNKQVNFEDNIFILAMRTRMIRDTITLDVDPELFLEKTLDDIRFIDYGLRFLLGQLLENKLLIERDGLLDHVFELEWQFSQTLQDLLNHEGNLSIREIPAAREQVSVFRAGSLERRKSAESLVPAGSGADGGPVVSPAELNELLKAL